MRLLLTLSLFLGLAGPGAAAAPARIVVVKSSELPAYEMALQEFQKVLAAEEVGFKLQTVTLPENPILAKQALTQLNAEKPSLVLTLGGSAAHLARTLVTASPVVFCMVLEADDELSYGGVVLDLPLSERVGRTLRSLPRVKKVGMIYHPERSASLVREIKSLEAVGSLQAVPASSPAEVDKAFSSLAGKVDCFLMMVDPVLFPTQALGAFLAQALERGMPVVGPSPAYVKAGAIAAFFADYKNNGELAAKAAARVLRGERLREIPIQSPTKVASSFNLIIARRLNCEITGEATKAATELVR